MPLKGGCGSLGSSGMVAVAHGRAEDHALGPGKGEEDTAAFGHDDGAGEIEARAVDDQVDAFGDAQARSTRRERTGPRAGGVDDGAGADLSRWNVAKPRVADPF